MKGEKPALQNELELKKSVPRVDMSKMERQNKMEAMKLELQAEKQAALEEAKKILESYQASKQIQLEEQRAETDTFLAALEMQKASHVAQLEAAMKTLECS